MENMTSSRTVVIPSIDCDPGNTDGNSHLKKNSSDKWVRLPEEESRNQYKEAILKLFSIFNRQGLKGKVTWMINERDVRWTKRFPELLKMIIDRKDTIGLHTHFGGLFGGPKVEDENTAFEIIKHSKSKLEKVIGRQCITHRSGCFYQANFIYRALKKANFRIVSDVNPGRTGITLEGTLLDNSNVPVNVSPWRHEPHNWLEYNSENGHFLHIPVSAEGIGMLRKSEFLDAKFICWDIHPHEIQNLTGEIDCGSVETLEGVISRMNSKLSPVYMNSEAWGR